jgi:hypothetical protein
MTMLSIVPMQAIPNRRFTAIIPIDEQNIELQFTMQYNEISEMWYVDVEQGGRMLISAYPLIPAQNILEQFEYLSIGSACIVPRTDITKQFPDINTLKNEWVVIWGDTHDNS